MKALLRKAQERALPAGFDIDTHLTPRYNPWDQRLCAVPDGDMFEALSNGSASIVTDQIDTFTETGIRLASGAELEAEIIVTATGLNMRAFGNLELSTDGVAVDIASRMVYKGIMLSDVPNLAFGFGYTNASWTLKIDLTYDYVWRLLEHMDETGTSWCMPRRDASVGEAPFLDFESGYVQRAIHTLPKSGDQAPWRVRMNYLYDVVTMSRGRVDDDTMEFGQASTTAADTAVAAAS
jgi:cation diffusion facilitator CzcD-associated flavoprotein CzcO